MWHSRATWIDIEGIRQNWRNDLPVIVFSGIGTFVLKLLFDLKPNLVLGLLLAFTATLFVLWTLWSLHARKDYREIKQALSFYKAHRRGEVVLKSGPATKLLAIVCVLMIIWVYVNAFVGNTEVFDQGAILTGIIAVGCIIVTTARIMSDPENWKKVERKES